MTPASTAPIELEIVASSRPRLAQALRELWACRGTIAFAERDIRVKYKHERAAGLGQGRTTQQDRLVAVGVSGHGIIYRPRPGIVSMGDAGF